MKACLVMTSIRECSCFLLLFLCFLLFLFNSRDIFLNFLLDQNLFTVEKRSLVEQLRCIITQVRSSDRFAEVSWFQTDLHWFIPLHNGQLNVLSPWLDNLWTHGANLVTGISDISDISIINSGCSCNIVAANQKFGSGLAKTSPQVALWWPV